MPSKKQEFNFPGLRAEQILVFTYGTFLELGWSTKLAVPDAVVAYIPKAFGKNEIEIIAATADGILALTSSIDMSGKNKKNINDFITTFENIRSKEPKEEWKSDLENLMRQTEQKVTEQQKQEEEINKVMHFNNSNLYGTYAIIAVNVIVFILMAINGAGIFDADGYTQIEWGSNFTPLTLSGDWWRMISCMFIHFGIIHLAMNMYALYMAGVYLEPMLGKTKFILAYFCSGVIASLASLWWHSEGVNSAGASGAIFGIYGVFLSLLFTNLIPKQIRSSLLSSIGVFVVFNLIYGVKSGIDNAAHIGGLLSGAVIGFVFYPLLKKNIKGIQGQITLIAIAVITGVITWMYLSSTGNKISEEERNIYLDKIEKRELD